MVNFGSELLPLFEIVVGVVAVLLLLLVLLLGIMAEWCRAVPYNGSVSEVVDC